MLLRKFCSMPRVLKSQGDQEALEDIFDLMRKGDERIVLDPKYKSPTYVLGNTGSGKSSLLLFVATDNKTLRSEQSNKGSGDFLIVDDEEKIGSGINSQTDVPELMVDKETQAAFYDCPGFNDTRTPVNEIATSYFIKKIFDFADEIKIVLTVIHPSVREGVERTDFMKLMRNATTLIKDIDKYENSIGLLVTKVENQYVKNDGVFVLVPDENVIAAIASCLENDKTDIKERLETIKMDEKEKSFLKNDMKLIDKLLVKDSAGKFPKIGIFRRPDEAGPLLEVELLQERKPALKQLLHETLKFTKKDSADIGYTISDTAKLDVIKIVAKLRDHVSTEIDKIVAALDEEYQGVAAQIHSIINSFGKYSNDDVDEHEARVLSFKLSSSFDTIHKLKSDVVKAKTIKDIAEAVKVCGTEVGLDTKGAVNNLMQQDNYFEFLQNINGGLSIGNYSKSFDGILVTIAATNKEIEKDTERMANSVRDRISNKLSFVAKQLKPRYSAKIESFGIDELVNELNKQQNIMTDFVEAIKKVNTAQELSNEISKMVFNSEINSSEINATTLDVLNNGNYLTVLKIFKDDTNVWSSDWVKSFDSTAQFLQVSAKWYNFLQKLYKKLSTYDYLGHSERYNVANLHDWSKDGKPQGIRITKMNYKQFCEKVGEHSDEVLEINFDETRTRELNRVLELTIKQKISTEMKDNGELVIEAVFVKFSDIVDENGKLKVTTTGGKKVEIVKIFATDTVFIDGDLSMVGSKLQVIVVAPNWEIVGKRTVNLEAEPLADASFEKTVAGKGKDGKPGPPGNPGGNFVGVGYEFKSVANLTVTSKGGRGGIGQMGGDGLTGANGADAEASFAFRHEFISRDTKFSGLVSSNTTVTYKMFGRDGDVGGTGGDGGVGGLGGLPGTIKVLRIDGKSNLPAIESINGPTGEGGEGGNGGQGGRSGDDLLAYFAEGPRSGWLDKSETIIRNDRAGDGSKGKRNFNAVERKEPESADSIDIGEILNSFEFNLRQVVHDRFLKQTLKKFLDQLHLNKTIYKDFVYDTKSLAKNLGNLEGQLYQLQLTNDEIIYLYQTIIERVTAYSKNPKPSEDTKEHKKALKYICTAALCQIQFRKTSLTPNLIIDVSKYLDFVLKNMNSLKDLNEKDSKLRVVNESKEQFKSNVNKKIAEAQGFIRNEILPEIEKINDKLDEQIDKLVDEVIKLEAATVIEKQNLIEKKSALQSALVMNGLFSVFKMFGPYMGPLGKVGEVTTTIIDTAVGPTTPKPVTVRSKRSAPDDEIEVLETAVGQQIQEAKTEIKEAKLVLPDVEALSKFYTRYSGDKAKMSAIDEAIKKEEDKLKKFKEFEKDIYGTMIPKLDQMEKTLDEISGQLGSKSQVSLDVTQWNIQSMLRDLKLQMKQATTGYKVEADISRYIEKLEDAMTTQINLYDRIQSYQDQQVLTNFIADVSTGIAEENPVLSQTFRTLDIMMRSNLVLVQYKQAVNALTQHVFPFAKLYLIETVSAPNSGIEEGLQNIAMQAAKKIEEMKSKLNEYKASITKQDQYLTKSEFNSGRVSVRPFYVWPNEDYKTIISRLLAGKKVTLYTDVRSANIDKFAVKFNLSEINFKIVDNTKQKDLNEKLKRFKANMTHMGNSYYRFQDRIYVIHSESQTIQYTFERRDDGRPTKFNGVYEKIKNGDLMLSPYAMWEIQLAKAEADNADYFKDLKAFEGQVDLELVGEGNFVSEDVKIPNLRVENYYEPSTTTFANKF